MNHDSFPRLAFQALRRLDASAFAAVINVSLLGRRIKPEHLPALGAAAFVIRYVRFWLAVWLGLWLLDPHVLVGSRAGLQTVFQVTPAALVAVLVFAIGSVFTVIQSLISTYGMRAAILVPLDPRVVGTVLRPLLLLFAALLISGQVPDSGSPDTPITAAATVVALATISATLATVAALPAAFAAFLAPTNFARAVTRDVHFYLESEAPGMVGFRVGLLEQMLIASLRRGDMVGSKVAIRALLELHGAYLANVTAHPSIRSFSYDDGTTVVGWFGNDLGAALSRGGEQYLAAPASEDVYVDIATALQTAGTDFAAHGLTEESKAIITAQLRLATSIHQATGSGVVNNWSSAAQGLAATEAAAEAAGHLAIAAQALAAWCVATSYIQTRFNERVHPNWLEGVGNFGPNAPFDAAADVIMSDDYLRQWIVKMPLGPMPVIGNLAQAKEAYERKDDPDYVPAPFREEQPAEHDGIGPWANPQLSGRRARPVP